MEAAPLDLANLAEINNIGSVDSQKIGRKQRGQFLESKQSHDRLCVGKNKGGIVSLRFNVLEF